ATVIGAPLIQINPIAGVELPPLDGYQWLVITSLHGARGLGRLLNEAQLDARALAGVRVAAVGPRTEAELAKLGLRADLVPSEHRATALVRDIAQRAKTGERALFIGGTLGGDEVCEGLSAHGLHVTRLDVYDTAPRPMSTSARRAAACGLDAVLLYSPSATRAFASEDIDVSNAIIACIGPTTAAVANEAGLDVHIVPETYSDDGMVSTLIECFNTP
ncbi:MAG: uroporphyrinogen-III synthase, partial [Planctomycetota bacterium]